jgi:DNA-binding NtrC family response regulator
VKRLGVTSQVALVIERKASRRDEIAGCVAEAGLLAMFVEPCAVVDAVGEYCPVLVLVVAGSGDPTEALNCLARMKATLVGPRFIFVTSMSSEDLAIAALHAGAERYLKEPWTSSMLAGAMRELLSSDASHVGQPDRDGLRHTGRFVGRGAASQQLRSQLAGISPTDSSVLITGETGTGKDVVAELIHLNSKRAEKPFVCLNTAALPDALVENELFGHERGAYTGAVAAQDGKLVAADGGTLFLDEIGDVSLAVQAKLLRAIECKTIYRVGGTRSIRFDARIIAATNQDLERAANESRFRSDLYYRLNVIRMRLPPLRDRAEDIPLLVNHYLRRLNREMGRSIRGLSPRAMETLCAYDWPGNVRELRNAVEALLVNLAPETTGIVDIPSDVMRQLAFAAGAPTTERERLLQTLAATNWNKSKAANQLHWSRMTLYRKMHEHKVELRR